jgi:hypothetical protein
MEAKVGLLISVTAPASTAITELLSSAGDTLDRQQQHTASAIGATYRLCTISIAGKIVMMKT